MDEIILVGFSRGAFTARALAFLINEVGLLKKEGLRFLHDLFEAWSKQSRKKKLLRSIVEKVKWLNMQHYPVKIQTCAVWDTVAALGRLEFVNETIPACVEQAIHALALNEERSQFEPLLFHRGEGQSLKQCWFLGSHSEVGGGNKKLGLANISLAWMLAQLKDLVYFDPSIVKSMTSQQGHDCHSEALRAEIVNVSSGGQSGAYELDVEIPIREFQAKSDVHVGAFAKTQRVTGWKYRKAFESAHRSEETLHWTVTILLEKECVSTCVPLQRFGYTMQITQRSVAGSNSHRPDNELPTLYERSVLANWIISESLQAAYKASSPSQDRTRSKTEEALSKIPIYAVLWQPEEWNLTSSTNLGRQVHAGLKHGGQMKFQTPTHETTVDSYEQSVEIRESWKVTVGMSQSYLSSTVAGLPICEVGLADLPDQGGFKLQVNPFGNGNLEHQTACKVLAGKITVPIAETLILLDNTHTSNGTSAEQSSRPSDSWSVDGMYSTTRHEGSA